MKLYEAITKEIMPLGEGELASNWGWLIGRLINNNIKELELNGKELTCFITYIVNTYGLVLSSEIIEALKKDHKDFTFWDIHITKLKE